MELGKTVLDKPTKKDTQMPNEQNAMTYRIGNDRQSKNLPMYYDELVNDDDSASKTSLQITNNQELKNLIVTNNEITKDDRMRWPKDSKDPYSLNGVPGKDIKKIDNDYSSFKKDIYLPYDKDPIISNSDHIIQWPKDPTESFNVLFNGPRKQTQQSENQYLSFAKFIRMPYGDPKDGKTNAEVIKDPYDLYRAFKKHYAVHKNERTIYNEYENEMELQSEITYNALKRQIKIADDKEAKESDNLYKALNRIFKKSNTEDFFRDPVAACVEVLEYVSVWIAEKLSLPPPEPVDHDVVIYKRQDKNNYSYLTAVIKNKKVQYLISRGMPFNDSDAIGYMYLNQ